MTRLPIGILARWVLPLLAAGTPSFALAAEPVDYARDVQPLLAQHCYKCHGPDSQKSGLRLDTVTATVAGGYNGPAFERGKSAQSLLIQVLLGQGDVARMPFESDPLPESEIAIIRQWIDAGAPAPANDSPAADARPTSEHWSFQPIVRPEPPQVSHAERVRNPIDAFIQSRLEQQGIEPSPETDSVTLIRRLSLDLLGLPPSIAEVDEFLADTRPDAYEHLVERLLASPHYGERWGRHWLDLARYADSNGYTNDNPRSIWPYRDWVIAALNRDLPFDQFTIEQIAGDMLPSPTRDQQIATGFHRNTLQNEEGGTDPEEFRIESVVDRVSTTGSVFLGLTIGCARCHDHKFDPLSQLDFYRLFAMLNGANEPTLSLPNPAQAEQRDTLNKQLASAQDQLTQYDLKTADQRAQWEQQFAGRLSVEWIPLDPVEYVSASGATFTKLDDRSILVGGPRPPHDAYTISTAAPPQSFTAVKLEALTHDSLPQRGPGRAGNGNFVLGELTLGIQPTGSASIQPVAWISATADHSQDKYPAANLIDGDPKTGWAINVIQGSLNVDRQAILATASEVPPGSAGHLVFTFAHQHSDEGYLLGRFRLSVTNALPAALALNEPTRQALTLPADQRSSDQRQLILDEYQKSDSDRQKLSAELAKAKQELSQFEQSLPTTLVMLERAEPRTTYLLRRGQYLQNGPAVQPAVPAVLPQLPTNIERPTRLDLARWLVSPSNPLVTRVTVNRFWQQYFGRGLVDTPEDFGTQGARPTHPELLDWLASEFVARGWSQKALHRLIVTSAVYRRESRVRADLVEVDADNKLLARQVRLRVEAEIVRDSMLASSGLLTRQIGGPSVFPPQPDGVMALTRSPRPWKVSEGADRYRRGMYTYFWRSTPHPFLKVFDAPDGNTTCARRDRANTPLQALTLLNDEACVEAAAALAARVLQECPDQPSGERIRHAFRLCLARQPSDYERACLAELLADELSGAARAATSAKDSPAAETASPDSAERSAWTSVARAVMNLDEFMTRE